MELLNNIKGDLGGVNLKWVNNWIIFINNRLPYNPKLKQRAKELRKNMTIYETKVWKNYLKNLQNIRILRQRPIWHYIVDFYIPQIKLVIEIDWESHFDERWIEYDIERTWYLEWLWLEVIRFTNNQIINDFELVCKKLNNFIWLQLKNQ